MWGHFDREVARAAAIRAAKFAPSWKTWALITRHYKLGEILLGHRILAG